MGTLKKNSEQIISASTVSQVKNAHSIFAYLSYSIIWKIDNVQISQSTKSERKIHQLVVTQVHLPAEKNE